MKNIEITLIPISQIVPDENQPRELFEPSRLKALKDSVKKYGIKMPLTVEKVGDKYLLVNGERRYRVSKELGMKEVPCVIEPPKSVVDRMIEQYHIQEMNEGWTSTEKAVAVNRIAHELGVSIEQLAELLGLSKSNARRYIAFATLVGKKEFQKNNIGLEYAGYISASKNQIKRIYQEILDKDWSKTVEKDIEMAYMRRIQAGDISKRSDMTKIKDSFTKEPKLIQKFLDTDITSAKLFTESKARGAYHLRNAVISAGYVAGHLSKFEQNADVKPRKSDIDKVKLAQKNITKFLDEYGENYQE